MHHDKIYQAETQKKESLGLFEPSPEEQGGLRRGAATAPLERRQAGPSAPPLTSELQKLLHLLLPDNNSDGEERFVSSSIASRTRKQTREIIQAPLREAVGSANQRLLVKSFSFSTIDLEGWERIAKSYRSDLIKTAKRLRYMIKQHKPDWFDLQLLL